MRKAPGSSGEKNPGPGVKAEAGNLRSRNSLSQWTARFKCSGTRVVVLALSLSPSATDIMA